jgi:hypothetical protein
LAVAGVTAAVADVDTAGAADAADADAGAAEAGFGDAETAVAEAAGGPPGRAVPDGECRAPAWARVSQPAIATSATSPAASRAGRRRTRQA